MNEFESIIVAAVMMATHWLAWYIGFRRGLDEGMNAFCLEEDKKERRDDNDTSN
jgi:hypothetical protein